MYTIEVLIAASIIFVAFAFLFKTPPAQPEIETSMIKKQGFDSLEFMKDSDFDLRFLAHTRNESRIEEILANLTRGLYEVEICGEGSACLDMHVPQNQTVMIIDYYISGYRDSYSPKKVRMFLWRRY